MTYANADVRHAFHQLPLQDQLIFLDLNGRVANKGYFLHIQEIPTGSDVILRLYKQPISEHADTVRLGDD